MTDDIDEAIRLERRRILEGLKRLEVEELASSAGCGCAMYGCALDDVAELVSNSSEVSNGQ